MKSFCAKLICKDRDKKAYYLISTSWKTNMSRQMKNEKKNNSSAKVLVLAVWA